jgi:hypothetical protein
MEKYIAGKRSMKNTYVVESWLIVYFKKERHGE